MYINVTITITDCERYILLSFVVILRKLGASVGCYGALLLSDRSKKKKKVEDDKEHTPTGTQKAPKTPKKTPKRERAKPLDVRVGVAAMLVKNDGGQQLLLMGKRMGSHGSGKFAFPGGHLELNESWAECARREVEEETGLVVEKFEQVAITNDIMESEGKHYITIFMKGVVTADQPEPETREPDKCEGWAWKEWGEVKAMPDSSLFVPVVN